MKAEEDGQQRETEAETKMMTERENEKGKIIKR
jgi:hypothetical protein